MKHKIYWAITMSAALLAIALGANAATVSDDPTIRVRDTGNAGDAVAMDFVRYGHRALEILRRGESDIVSDDDIKRLAALMEDRTIVRSEPKVFVYDEVLGRSIEVDATNFATADGKFRILVSQSRWPTRADGLPRTDEDKMAMSLHEFGGLLKLEINTYQVSARFREQLDVVSRIKPVVLKEIKAQGRSGMTESDVRSLCAEQQKIFEPVYFYVYCDLEAHDWHDREKRTGYYQAAKFMGYRYYRSSSSESGSWWASFWGIFQSRGSYAYSESSTSISPVYAYESVPYQYEVKIPRSVYGIKVFGLGRFDEVPYKVMKRSDRLARGLKLTYETSVEAMSACLDSLIAGQRSRDEGWKYERARCRAIEMPAETGSTDPVYRYEIRTQNPFLFVK